MRIVTRVNLARVDQVSAVWRETGTYRESQFRTQSNQLGEMKLDSFGRE